MKTKRRTEIRMETHETTIIRFRSRQPIIFCQRCQTNTRHLTLVEAISITSLSEPAIRNLALEQQIHWTRTADGLLMLCGISLATQVRE